MTQAKSNVGGFSGANAAGGKGGKSMAGKAVAKGKVGGTKGTSSGKKTTKGKGKY